MALLRQLSEAYPTMPQAPARLGDLLRRRNRFAEAAAAYDQALSRGGQPGRRALALLYARGIAYERSGAGRRPRPTCCGRSSWRPSSPTC